MPRFGKAVGRSWLFEPTDRTRPLQLHWCGRSGHGKAVHRPARRQGTDSGARPTLLHARSDRTRTTQQRAGTDCTRRRQRRERSDRSRPMRHHEGTDRTRRWQQRAQTDCAPTRTMARDRPCTSGAAARTHRPYTADAEARPEGLHTEEATASTNRPCTAQAAKHGRTARGRRSSTTDCTQQHDTAAQPTARSRRSSTTDCAPPRRQHAPTVDRLCCSQPHSARTDLSGTDGRLCHSRTFIPGRWETMVGTFSYYIRCHIS